MGRNIVVCCDGTWNTPTQTDRGMVVPSNVVKMARAVEEGKDQLIYYDSGVGTGKGLDRLTGGALGIGLTDNIKQAYRKIADEYKEGDNLFLFGFSRGAYTVRSLAGLIGRCGLVNSRDDVDKAYDLYRKAGDGAGRKAAEDFKAAQASVVTIHFLGVWDTVGALGVPAISKYGLLRKTIRLLTDNTSLAHGFHDETLGDHITHAYQALAIDERRGPFSPALWKTKDGQPQRKNCEQVWFAGAHSNVGGGYIDSGLSDHAFMWMAVKAMDAGLKLDQMYLAMRVDPNAHGEMRDECHGLYKFMDDHVRTVGGHDTLNEKVHASVFNRMRHSTNAYSPANLAAVQGDVLETQDGIAEINRIRSALYGAVAASPPPP